MFSLIEQSRRDYAARHANGRTLSQGRCQTIRLTYALIDIWCTSYTTSPVTVTLDIDDTVDIVNGHYDERCFLPIHIYDTTTDLR